MSSLALLRSLAPLVRYLPQRLALTVFYRFYSRHCGEMPEMFEMVPLRLAPRVRLGLKAADVAHGTIAFAGVYEPNLTRVIWNLARDKGGTLLDVGANYGYYSILWCAARGDNTAVAVEASPRNISGLRHNIESNEFGSRIELLPWAASDFDGEVGFDLGPLEQTGWGGMTHDSSENIIKVPCYRLDQILNGRSFAAMKIDCEGGDFLVIQGAEKLLASKAVEHVFFEENEKRMESLGLRLGSSRGKLMEHGFSVAKLGRADSVDHHASLNKGGILEGE